MFTNENSKTLTPFLQKCKDNSGKFDPDDRDYCVGAFLKDNDVTIDPRGSEICDFLKGKSIFVTGGTGFLGKLLVEKLLRACIEIDQIYLLVREKRNKDQNERVAEIFGCDSALLEKLGEMHPSFREKIQVINGDLGKLGLGINETDRNTLIKKVNIIYHVAATTRFNEHIKKAVDVNIRGSREVINLARQCQNLDSMVYVGTAFSNCNQTLIEEKFYEPRIDPDKIIAITEKYSEEELSRMTDGLLGQMPNTYTLTKQIAESIVRNEGENLPICIFRPSIVICTYKEPIKSWSDNVLGPIGMMVAVGVGLIRVMPGNENGVTDVVPADYVVNACIACSYITAKTRAPKVPKIFNFSSSHSNPITWSEMTSIMVKYAHSTGTTYAVWYPGVKYVKSVTQYIILDLLYHKVLAYIVDALLWIFGKKPKLVAGYKKIDKFVDALSYFTLNEWNICSDNTSELWNSLNSHDKEMFPFNIHQLNWKEFLALTAIACRVYILKEPLDNLEDGRKIMKAFFYIEVIVKVVVYAALAWFLYKIFLLFI